MTFRSRVITATVAAAAIAVILACFASFLTTRNSLIHSVDESLSAEANRHAPATRRRSSTSARTSCCRAAGRRVASSSIPVDATVLAVAKGKSAAVYRTVSIGDRQLPRIHRAAARQFRQHVPERQRVHDQDHVGRTVRSPTSTVR